MTHTKDHPLVSFASKVVSYRTGEQEIVARCDSADRAKQFAACVNALAGMNPDALAGLIEAADAARCDFPLPHLDAALARLRGEA